MTAQSPPQISPTHAGTTVDGLTQRPRVGVLWMVASGLSFIGVNGIVRYLGTDLPAAQSAFVRFSIGLLVLAPMLGKMLKAGLPPGALPLILGRGVVHSGAVLFWFYAMARIPVAHVTAIGYLSPVILLIAGALLLGEVLTMRRIVAVAVAFAGAMVVLRPGWQPVTLGHLSQMAAAVGFAGSYLYAKKLSLILPASTVVALLSLTVTIGLLPLAIWVWVPTSWAQIGWLSVVAVLATMAHYFMTRAFMVAPLTVTQPVIFLQLIWATALGAVLFDEALDGYVLLGGAMIFGAITWVTWKEGRSAAGGRVAKRGTAADAEVNAS